MTPRKSTGGRSTTKKTAAGKKPAKKKPAKKKPAAKKPAAKKPAAKKKPAARKTAARKTTAEKPAAKKRTKKTSVYHLVPDGTQKWNVKKEGGKDIIGFYTTKDQAIRAARGMAKAHAPARTVVHRQDGTIETTFND